MRFNINMPMDAIRELARRCIEALNRNRQPVRQSTGRTLYDNARLDFDRKANGAAGVDGTVWPPDSPETQRAKGSRLIGIRTGEMRESLRVDENPPDGDVAVEYTAPHAEWFDKKRSLLPVDMPDAWLTAIEGDVQEWAEREVQHQLDTFQQESL